MHAGSYLHCGDEVRRFAPEEIVRLLHFPDGFRFPAALPLRRRWHLVGNSLSVAAVREVLRAFPAMNPGIVEC
jgi:DNA (cytosine-5)-methyltransferase 1/tRNA (cytosine38-C5)-methyltransferase